MSSLLRTLAVLSILALLGLAIVALETPMRGEVAQPKKDTEFREPVSALHCIGCHDGKGDAYKAYVNEKRDEFILLNEYDTWHSQDLHAKAFDNIRLEDSDGKPRDGKLAWKMQRILRQSRSENYRVDKAGECLACHSVDLSWKAIAGKSAPITESTANADNRFFTKHGVSCEACHGFADRWLGEHIKTSWREKSPAEKRNDYGQVDLRSTQVRAERCASCHIGNKDEGKFVTHEMYAAGHPPLPVFELSSYSQQAPRHYTTVNQVKAIKEMTNKKDLKNFHYRAGEVAEAREIAIGTVAAFRANMRLLQSEAAKIKPNELLDYAHFDCAACHHDLKYPGDRQNRNDGRIPGRPLMKMPTELLEAVLDHASDSDLKAPKLDTMTRNEIDVGLKNLRAAFDARPFGDPKQIEECAGKLAGLCDKALTQIDAVIYTDEVAKDLSRKIASRLTRNTARPKDAKLAGYLDHDSAQQLAWAALALRKALHPKDEIAHNKAFAKLADTILLTLRDENHAGNADSVECRLKDRLNKQNSYNSEAFIGAMSGWLKTFDEGEKKR